MEKLSLSSTPSPATLPGPFLSPLISVARARRKAISFLPLSKCNPKKFTVSALKDDDSSNKLNQWDLMELKFGQMIGEDPKLTLAKIKGRKLNPDASYLDIEKSFYKNKGKMVEVKEVPFDVPEKRGSTKAANGLNLVKPVPKKGIKVGGGDDNINTNLPEMKRPNVSVRSKVGSNAKSNVPNVILRKPSLYSEKDDEVDSSSRLRIKPNLSLSMRTEPVKERFSGMTLLKKPEAVSINEDHDGENENSLTNGSLYSELVDRTTDDFEGAMANEGESTVTSSGEMTLLDKPNATMLQDDEANQSTFVSSGEDDMLNDRMEGVAESNGNLSSEQDQLSEGSLTGMQPLEQTDAGQSGKENGVSEPPAQRATVSEFSVESVLLGRPKRLDQSMRDMPYPIEEETGSVDPDGMGKQEELTSSRPLKAIEETDWTRVEKRCNVGDRVEVELISCSPRGFVASFGSLIGFLPYRNLAAKWKFLAFESWLRRKGLDPSKYRKSLGIIGNDEVPNKSSSLESSPFPEVSQIVDIEVTADMELDDLLRIYDQEKIQYLSSYVGQHIRVNIVLADRKSRKLIFSMKPKEKEETVERKRNLMAKLTVGDVVKCCIKKITYFGIFVEVEGVPALIHQSEVSWDATLDPASYLKTGQIVEAKVHQLDFALERIFLSLKEITPDPLNEALECIVGNSSFDGGLEAAQADSEWPEVELLIKELQEIEGIETVTKGRFFLSPGLAPTFQVYMAPMFENQYKLLARSGNKVQEVMVEASLDKEDMKSIILKCTNRVDL